MQLYEIVEASRPAPLTAAKIGFLFHAGRLSRNSPCRLSGQPQWRTVDELFPLLKYDSSGQWISPADEPGEPPRSTRYGMITALIGLVFAAAVIALYFASDNPPTSSLSPRKESAVRLMPSQPPVAHISPRVSDPPASATPYPHPSAFVSAPTPAANHPPAPERKNEPDRFEQARLAREQLQREQTATADRLRAEAAARELAQRKAAGRDEVVELDRFVSIDLGGVKVSVKIHDNDVTSFDAWVNGAHFRDIQKEKGITGSRADETLIYSIAKARLYYVWEISGKLNHCRLRVRED